MGMDLCLYPCHKGYGCNAASPEWLAGVPDGEEMKPDILGFSRLDLNRNYELFDQIEGFGRSDNGHAPVVPVYQFPPNTELYLYNDEGLEKTDTDSYGARLTFAWGKDMKKLKASHDEGFWNKAVLAFIQAMSDDALYILYWH